MQIAVFCSSSNKLLPIYYQEAENLGTFIGADNHTLVYGGVNKGLMESIAKRTHEAGGFIIGILPSNMRALASEYTNELLFVETLGERKELIKEYADVFIVLPGGFGTLDEMFDVLACEQVGEHDKKLIIVNSNNFYDQLITMFEKIFIEKFGSGSNKNGFVVVNNVAECAKYLRDNAL